MNELLFLFHAIVVIAFGFGALRLGPAAITAWAAIQAVLANLFVIKQITLFGFHITCSDVFAIGSVLGINLLREYYGKESAKKALWSCFYAMLFFAAMAKIHLLYLPSSYDTTQGAFETLLSPSSRLLAASFATYLIVQLIDLRLFGLLKEKCGKIPLVVRNALSLSSTQLLDTVLFSILGLWGLVSHLSEVIVISFAVKVVIIALMSPLISFSRRFAHAAV
ncbi:MAG: queuosine precursor transporter [Chlamydiota bacterium]